MLLTVEELRQYITTEETDQVLEARLQALELSIRRYTNNNFMFRGIRTFADAFDHAFECRNASNFAVGDTVQVSMSDYMDGQLCTIAAIEGNTITVNEPVYHEDEVILTKVLYPLDVKLGAVEILKWKLKNAAAASGDKSAMPVQSETISRHSVTYAQDASEADIDSEFGVPKKYVAFLKGYKKARF
jgi:hypothetical protein